MVKNSEEWDFPDSDFQSPKSTQHINTTTFLKQFLK